MADRRIYFATDIHGSEVCLRKYGGLMEVTSRAAAQAGGTVIGLPMRGWAGLTPNRWNSELRWSDTYPERLAHFLGADAIVAVDGGIGTLAEAAIVWAALQTEPDGPDLIFLGAGWPAVLESLGAHLVIDDRDLGLVTICADPRLAIAHIAKTRPGRRRAPSPRG
jgi:predicted Rossmann-fold nucleotide-binding protein